MEALSGKTLRLLRKPGRLAVRGYGNEIGCLMEKSRSSDSPLKSSPANHHSYISQGKIRIFIAPMTQRSAKITIPSMGRLIAQGYPHLVSCPNIPQHVHVVAAPASLQAVLAIAKKAATKQKKSNMY